MAVLPQSDSAGGGRDRLSECAQVGGLGLGILGQILQSAVYFQS